MKNDNVIAPGMFRINPSKTSREDKFVSINKVRARVRTNLIIVLEPHVITKKGVNSKSNGLSSTRVDNTAKTRRPQPRSNTKNHRVPSESKSSCIKNKEVEVEEHLRNLLLSNNKKHMSSECNNAKFVIRNVKSEVVYAMCKQCLITTNHDDCVLNYVNGMNSRDMKQKANVSKTAKQKKHKPQVKKPNKLGSKERLASPKPGKPRICLSCSKHITENLKLLINFVWKFLGTVRFGNDHVAEILGFGDLQWGNILISRVYFVEGLGHNLFSVGQFWDSDLEAAFRRNIEYYDSVGISHQASSVRTPQQNGVVERRNQTLVQAARTMLILSRAPLFLWAEAIATAYYTQNRSIIHRRFNKTPYELINCRKFDISFLHVFGSLCYPKNDREDIGKLAAKGYIGFFISYSVDSYAYSVYN
ncbi:retrovirus-related pol polyprotein from transposon TNT 1-94 [Tanacetum coccineum]